MIRDPDQARAPIVGLADTLLPGLGEAHSHQRAQVIYAVTGTLTVITAAGRWVLPPNRALGIPGGLMHRVALGRPAELRTLYLLETPAEWKNCAVFSVSPLLRALILAQTETPWDYARAGPEARLAQVLLDRLSIAHQEPVHLPDPIDPRARRLADHVRTAPTDMRPLAALAAEAGASLRTLERLFETETGLSLGAWRQRARLLVGLVALAEGAPVLDAALRAGYESASSFTYAFRLAFGTTPARYFADPIAADVPTPRAPNGKA